jgi:cytochrome c553
VIRKIVIAVGSVLAIQAVGAFLFAWSGLYSVAASDRHWPITYWFLVFGLRNSIETHSIGIEVPPLDDMSLVYRGIGHYRGGCEPCHGAPGSSPNPITQQMLPEPPYMPDVVHDWEPQHLFWIVRNGLKYSGMPGWVPPERADEVWAVVAALLRLPEMSPEEYQKLSGGEVASRSDIVGETAELIGIAGPVGNDLLACGRCHGLKGTGGGAGGFPRLAGQKQDYLYETMKSYAIGNRPSGMMQPVAVELTDEQLRQLASYYAGITAALPPPDNGPDSAELVKQGRTIVEHGIPGQNVPACATCHGVDGMASDKPGHYPRLAGQYAGYLQQQLTLWNEGRRGDSPHARIMSAAARGLNADQIRAVAHYYASLR